MGDLEKNRIKPHQRSWLESSLTINRIFNKKKWKQQPNSIYNSIESFNLYMLYAIHVAHGYASEACPSSDLL